jgi:hypothetical protein
MQESLFDTNATRALARLPKTVGTVFERLLDAEPVDPSRLRDELSAYEGRLVHRAETAEFLDLKSARIAIRTCACLLDLLLGECSDVDRSLVQAAAHYVLLERDAERDTGSPIGFDDDVLVVQTVAAVLGRTNPLSNL